MTSLSFYALAYTAIMDEGGAFIPQKNFF